MTLLRYTLAADGPRDLVLLKPIDWLLRQGALPAFAGTWADLRRLPRPPGNLVERVRLALDYYPCDVLFVHRDAERETPARRRLEIEAAVREACIAVPCVPVIPVRMTEAWLLFDEAAIRRAAGNPRGTRGLEMPSPNEVERIDAKERLESMLATASDLSGRHLRRFDVGAAVHRVADLIEDWSPLRALPSFVALEEDLRRLASRLT